MGIFDAVMDEKFRCPKCHTDEVGIQTKAFCYGLGQDLVIGRTTKDKIAATFHCHNCGSWGDVHYNATIKLTRSKKAKK
jgi:transcription elongation factor Elf1